MLVGEVPHPGRAIAKHNAALGMVEAAPLGLTLYTLGELRGGLVSVTQGGALDGGWVGYRTRVPHRRPLFIAPVGTPDSDQLDLARLGRAIGLLALAANQFRGTHGHTCPVQAQVQRWGDPDVLGRRLGHASLALANFPPQGLGGTLDVLGRHLHSRQLAEQLVPLLEADHGAYHPYHA